MTGLGVPARVPGDTTSDGDAILLGNGPVRVDAFVDFLCPFCRQFEVSAGPALARLVAGGQISLAYHPMNFLDDASTTGYSTRAAAAAGCAADRGKFAEYARALFDRQPPEGGPGLSDAKLTEIGQAAGLTDGFADCVRAAPYRDWPAYVTAHAMEAGVEATPTVLVAGRAVAPEARPIAAAVAEAAGR